MRLIDADELKGLYDPANYGADENWDNVQITFAEICADIDNQPTIDAVPVEHGHWEKTPIPIEIRNNTTRTYYFKCNKCSSTSWNRNNYCSHCGAKMDKEE